MIERLELPAVLVSARWSHVLRDASVEDAAAIGRLLANDAVSASRGDFADEDPSATLAAVREILATESNALLVATDDDGDVVATMQLTRIPGIVRGGAARLLVEAVRVRADHRSEGLGSAMMQWVTDAAAPSCGAGLVQLTSDATRIDAHRFYGRLGFVPSHVGFKYRVG